MKTTLTGVKTFLTTMEYADPITTIRDGQAQAPTTTSLHTTVSTSLSTWTSVEPVHTSPVKLAERQDDDGEGDDTDTDDDDYENNDNTALSTLSRRTRYGFELYTCASKKPLMAEVKNNQLFDGNKWIGYIASNYQLQFDEGVAQAGALYTSGFSVCDNDRLALGNQTVFYRCLSGNFYNLYDR